jgi:hypothetical protein
MVDEHAAWVFIERRDEIERHGESSVKSHSEISQRISQRNLTTRSHNGVSSMKFCSQPLALVFAALLLGTMISEPSSASANSDPVRLAQTTPLRFLTPQQQQCDRACQESAQRCYRNAKNNSAREACENQGIRCRQRC